MAEYMLFRCDSCGREQSGAIGSIGPEGWLQVQQQGGAQQPEQQGGTQPVHFCSHACLLLYEHDQADYRHMPRLDRLRTALQSLGILPRTGA